MVKNLVGEHAVLYLWVTAPYLLKSVEVLETWGFSYRSYHVWSKEKVGTGFWARSDAEVCLIAERGRPAPPPSSELEKTIFRAPKLCNQHSSKPSRIHDVVERCWPESRKIELFARAVRPGWECYGSDLGTLLTPGGIVESELP
jgi:N6-adenosine-specific RNA methylase IME4